MLVMLHYVVLCCYAVYVILHYVILFLGLLKILFILYPLSFMPLYRF